MEQEREEQLIKSIRTYAAGFYFDCTRYGLTDAIISICRNTEEANDYDKFATAIANVLFNKIYIEAEMLEIKLVTGIVDIIVDLFEDKKNDTGFAPANAMIGNEESDSGRLRDMILDAFNTLVIDCTDHDLMVYD